MRSLMLLALFSSLIGCAGAVENSMKESIERGERRYAEIVPGAVKKRAAFDLGCAEKDIAVTNLGSKTWGAAGCNKKGTYLVKCYNPMMKNSADLEEKDCTCILNSPVSQVD